MSWLRSLWAKWTMPPCPHKWRPALSYDNPAKYCDLCKCWYQITEGEFYALFGRTTHRFKKREAK